MTTNVVRLLKDLREYALEKRLDAAIFYHEEQSSLMRFANSAISLNTNEHLIRLEITVFEGSKQATYAMLTDPNNIAGMRQGVDIAADMVLHAQPLTYTPTVPEYKLDVLDMSAFDPMLASLTNEERLEYFNSIGTGLESDDIKLSGIFSSGITVTAQISTRTEHTQYFVSTDSQINAVLSHQKLKWEVIAQQSAQSKSDLRPDELHRDLAYLVNRYHTDPTERLPLGKYTVVFGADAVADVVDIMFKLGLNGGYMKRGYSFLTEDQRGKQILSPKFTLMDDPQAIKTFPFSHDLMGKERQGFALFERGIFNDFFWMQDDADEFGFSPTGHTTYHNSLVIQPGDMPVNSLEELVAMPRKEDILYIPYIHYLNIVNPSAGMITGSSRFGALLLKKDGGVVVPFNVRINQTYSDLFGERVEWLSREQTVCNVSSSYGQHNPTAIVVPKFLCVKGIEISHSNDSY